MKNEAYEPPESKLETADTDPVANTPVGRALAIVGTLVASTIMVGFGMLFIELTELFNEIVVDGQGDPRAVSGEIASASVSFLMLAAFSLLGFLLSFLTAIFGRYRSSWFFKCSVALCIVYLLLFPVGTIIAICFLVFLVRRREEFFPRPETADTASNSA
jgi:hypothetical protein